MVVESIVGVNPASLTDTKNSVIPRAVTILGKGMTGRDCLFNTEEVWGVNNVAEHPEYLGKKFHRLFAFDLLPKEYTDGMKKYCPVTSWQDYADIKYPLDNVIRTFNTRFFTNTISYMIAYAIYLKFEKIYIYGVEVSFGAPYAQENRGVDYWIGRAQERGIEVIVHPQSHLLRTCSGVLYGERDHCNVLMWLHERIALLNILPKQGGYSDSLLANNAFWVLFPKSDEAKANGLQIQKDPAGNMAFGFGPKIDEQNKPILDEKGQPKLGGEFTSDVHMPPQTWDYVRGILIDLERKNQLPFACVPIYEKIVLSKPPGGN